MAPTPPTHGEERLDLSESLDLRRWMDEHSPPRPTRTRGANGERPLHAAAAAGALASLRALLADPRTNALEKDAAGRTPLHTACLHGRAEAAAALLADRRARAALSVADRGGRTPLLVACAENRLEVVEALLASGLEVDWNARDRAGRGALELAGDTMKVFLRGAMAAGRRAAGQRLPAPPAPEAVGNAPEDADAAVPESAGKRRRETKDWAATGKTTEGPAQDDSSDSPAPEATSKPAGSPNPLPPGATPADVRTFLASDPPQIDVDRALLHAVLRDDAAVALALLASPRANPGLRIADRTTLLMVAAACTTDPAVVLALLADRRTDPAAKDYRGGTALHHAAGSSFRSREVLRALLHDPRLDTDAVMKGDTPFLRLLRVGQLADARLFLDPAVAVRTDLGHRHAITARGPGAVLRFRLNHKPRSPTVVHAVELLRADIVAAAANTPHARLVEACMDGDSAAAAFLLDAGTSPDRAATVRDHRLAVTPLDAAIARGDRDLAALLLDGGADPNHPSRGRTPLEHCVRGGRFDIFLALLAHPAVDPNRIGAGAGDRMPLVHRIAALRGKPWDPPQHAWLRALLAHPRTDPELRNAAGETALHAACRTGHGEAAEMLLADARVDAGARDAEGRRAGELWALGGKKKTKEQADGEEGDTEVDART
ncbi:ankyrin repeat-containing domain protein [Hyaloraphidium curvatum]|nr:ankyrin repeat-containing domain protein [Hyaloraphidium curvatum]